LRQTANEQWFEVIVVDNGSTDETPDLVKQLERRSATLRYVRQDRIGLSVARNTGVQSSRAPLVAFTDDDAVPSENWVELLLERFQSLPQEVAVLGGEVEPLWESPRPEWLTDTLLRPLSAGLMWGPEARLLKDDEWLVEVNIAYRKAKLIEFGAFPENLGRIGESLLSFDGCVNLLLARAGYASFYDPKIVVGHHIHASRMTPAWFRRRHFWQGVSMNRVHRYVDEMCKSLPVPTMDKTPFPDEEICLPSNAAGWINLFDNEIPNLEQQLPILEQLGYLLESQALLSGR
jgi:glycosyltransferase involved in cell wall biosynthesis